MSLNWYNLSEIFIVPCRRLDFWGLVSLLGNPHNGAWRTKETSVWSNFLCFHTAFIINTKEINNSLKEGSHRKSEWSQNVSVWVATQKETMSLKCICSYILVNVCVFYRTVCCCCFCKHNLKSHHVEILLGSTFRRELNWFTSIPLLN